MHADTTMDVRANARKLQTDSHLYTHRYQAGAHVSRNTDIQRHTYTHRLPYDHPDTARLVNTSALKTHTNGQLSKCRTHWTQECTHAVHTRALSYTLLLTNTPA